MMAGTVPRSPLGTPSAFPFGAQAGFHKNQLIYVLKQNSPGYWGEEPIFSRHMEEHLPSRAHSLQARMRLTQHSEATDRDAQRMVGTQKGRTQLCLA